MDELPFPSFTHPKRPALIVGRDIERQRLRDALDEAITGHGGLVIVGGEAGIGKTTLVEDLASSAADVGAQVLRGGCYDLIATPPYGPWVEILQSYAAHGDLLPLPPVLRDEAGLRSMPDQMALFQHMLSFLTSASSQRPLALFLEDLHWADTPSLDLLRFVARSLAAHRLLVVATYRSDEIGRGHQFATLLPALVRESPIQRITLRPLAADSTQVLVAARYRLAVEDVERLTAYLQRRAEGNPFFTAELLHQLEEQQALTHSTSGWLLGPLDERAVPPLIRQVIDARVDRLGAATRSVLQMAATIGQEFQIALLRGISATDDDRIDTDVEQALERHLLVETSDHRRLAFSHALVRLALYEGLSLPRRRALHQTIGNWLAQLQQPDPDTVGYHLHEAEDAHAISWLIQAGERAQALYAPQVAVEQLTRAIELADRLAIEAPSTAYRLRGVANETLGAFEPARTDFETVLRHAEASGDRQMIWQATIDLGRLWAERDYSRTGAYYQQALDLARTLNDWSILAHSLNHLGNWHLNVERIAEAIRLHNEALDLFRELDDQPGVAEALDFLGVAYYLAGDRVQSTACSQRAVAIFRGCNDRLRLCASLGTLAVGHAGGLTDLYPALPTSGTEGTRVAQLAVTLARELGWRSQEAYATILLTHITGPRGEYDQAFSLADAGLAIAEDIEHQQWMINARWSLAMVLADLLDPLRARATIESAHRLAHELDSRVWISQTTAVLAHAYIDQGDLSRAQSLLDSISLSSIPPIPSGQMHCWHAQARLALASGQPNRALEIAELLCSGTAVASPAIANPRLLRLRGDALAALDRLTDAEQAYQQARQSAVILGMRPLLWRIHLALATLYQRQGRIEAAADQINRARSIIDELALFIPDDALREHFLTRTTDLFPVATPERTSHGNPADGLTVREIEILRHVAEGLTDAEIAARLHLSPRTVNAHLRSIYGKLDVSSRTAATRIAIERGLT